MSPKKQPEQPVRAEGTAQQPVEAQPVQQAYGPAPQPANTPYQQQPVNQQYFAQPQAAPVQYVVMAESMKGLKGWLMFFTICFVLQAMGGIGIFFGAMTESVTAASVISMILAPFVAGSAIAAVVLISMGKKLGKWAAISAICVSAFYGIVMNIVRFISPTEYLADDAYRSSAEAGSVPALLGGIVITLLFTGLFSLYFINSRRVKETLVN